MSVLDQNPKLIEKVLKLSKGAGELILEIYKNYNSNFELKEDKSPLTTADIASHNLITKGLKNLTPSLPIISEEDSRIPFRVRSSWDQYWLIDPLDGTKEFLNKNDEFTVNIALIHKNEPIFGVIYIPVLGTTYWGAEEKGSFLIKSSGTQKSISVARNVDKKLRIVISRSHPSKELGIFLNKINDYEILRKGSSLKFCLIAEGMADIYPRLGPTSEWDIAAGEAIVKYAGGYIYTRDSKLMTYNQKHSYINPDFIVSNDSDIAKKLLAFY